MWAKHGDELRSMGITQDDVIARLTKMAETEATVREQTKQNTEAAQEWQRIWE